VIGTLALGERLDQGFVERLRDAFGSDIVVTAGSRVLGTTLPRGAADAAAWPEDPGSVSAPAPSAVPPVSSGADPAAAGAGGPPDAAHVIAIAGEEYVAAPAVIGRDQEGRAVSLHLLRSLSAALAGPHRSLLATLLGYGSLVVFLAGVSASVVGRSVLRPLDGLVAFMRSAAAGADRSRRFRHEGAGAEVRVLGEAFNRLLDALEEHERRLLQDAREEMHRLERLKESEKLAALGRMLSGAAHEINNPLTGVVGNIEMLLEQGGLDERVRRRLEQVRGEGRRIVALVRNLLKVARRGGGPRQTVDLNLVVRDAAALRRHDFERARVGLVLDLADRPIPLPADALELQQVFVNVINNAFDALHGRPGRPSLTVRTFDDAGQATVTFADNGPGMERPDQVFEHFYTTKPVGQGTGLGLSISQAIVQDHGGRITAENAPGGGALFRVVLPTGAAPAAGPSPAPPEAPAARRPLPASVLVVDDEPVVLELQMAILDGLGARAVAARSGREALDLLQARDFDLIVADLMLPGEIGGEEIHRWARANRRAGARGFLFVTGEVGGGAAAAATARRLQKPFTMDEYVAALREAWDELQTAA
jgi:signal transduction histidine kinase/ActR/RegA family two-component response regulator